MNDERSDLEAPQRTKVDTAHDLVKAAIGTVPIPGSAALAGLFDLIVRSPIEKRKTEWMESVAVALNDLFRRVESITPDSLSDDEGFISTIVEATQEALRTHQVEKRVALKNAVVNSAVPSRPDDDRRSVFVRFVGELTPLHLKVLALLADPPAFFSDSKKLPKQYGSREQMVNDALGESVVSREWLTLIANDLYSRGLTKGASFMGMISSGGAMAPFVSGIGNDFLMFITDSDEHA